MTLLTAGWPAWFSWEWVRDLAIPVIGVLVATFVGIAAVIVAQRTHALAEVVKAADDRHREYERDKAARRERVDFAALARRLSTTLRKDKLLEPQPDEDMAPDVFETYVREVAATLDDPQAAEDLVDRVTGLFSSARFPILENIDNDRRAHSWGTWRVADFEIRAYVAGRPLSDPHPREQLPVGHPSSPELRAEIRAWRRRREERQSEA